MSIKQYDIINGKDNLPKLQLIKEISSEEAEELLCFSNEEYERMEIMKTFFYADKYESEHMWCMAFGADKYLKGIYLSAIGDVRSVEIKERNMLIFLLLIGAIDCVFVHNHPDGIIHPSNKDLEIHYELVNLLKNIGFSNIDSYVIGEKGYCNVQTDNYIEWEV